MYVRVDILLEMYVRVDIGSMYVRVDMFLEMYVEMYVRVDICKHCGLDNILTYNMQIQEKYLHLL